MKIEQMTTDVNNLYEAMGKGVSTIRITLTTGEIYEITEREDGQISIRSIIGFLRILPRAANEVGINIWYWAERKLS